MYDKITQIFYAISLQLLVKFYEVFAFSKVLVNINFHKIYLSTKHSFYYQFKNSSSATVCAYVYVCGPSDKS